MQYEVDVYYSGYVTIGVDADSEAEAVVKARGIAKWHDNFADEFLNNLEPWPEADTVRLIKDYNP